MQEISLSELIRVIYRRIWIVVLITIAVTALIGGYEAHKVSQSAEYEASGQLVLKPTATASGDLATQNALANQLVATSQDLIQSTETLSQASSRLGEEGINMPVSAIQSGLTVSNNPNSLLISIKFKGADATVAAKTVKEVMRNFKIVAPKYMAVSKVSIIKGDLPVSASSSKRSLLKYTIAGLVLGVVLSLLVILLIELSRHTVRDEAYLSKKYHVRTIQVL